MAITEQDRSWIRLQFPLDRDPFSISADEECWPSFDELPEQVKLCVAYRVSLRVRPLVENIPEALRCVEAIERFLVGLETDLMNGRKLAGEELPGSLITTPKYAVLAANQGGGAFNALQSYYALDNNAAQSRHAPFGVPTTGLDASGKLEGLASPAINDIILYKPQYIFSYDCHQHRPVWVAWQLNSDWIGNGRGDGFTQDRELPLPPSVSCQVR